MPQSVLSIRLFFLLPALLAFAETFLRVADATTTTATHNAPHDAPPHNAPSEAWLHFLNEDRDPKGEWTNVPVEYGGEHPYDRTAQMNMNGRRRGQGAPTREHAPLRVHFDTRLLTALENSHPAHVTYIRDALLPSLDDFWREMLSVVPADAVTIPRGGRCAQEVKKLSGRGFADFADGNNNGTGYLLTDDAVIYPGVDLVVIVLPVEDTPYCPPFDSGAAHLQTLAFATNCQNDDYDRPTAGYTGICFGPIDPEDGSEEAHRRRVLTVAHEFAHILGMNSYDFPYFYDRDTGRPRTARDDYDKPRRISVPCVDGSVRVVEAPDENTLRATTTANGYRAYEVVTDTVRNVARNQFGCPTLEGARLENQPTAESDCFGSHWDHRLFNNEFMAAVFTGSRQYVTALTLALLEDSGWYVANYTGAENSPFGHGAGCEFAEGACVVNKRAAAAGVSLASEKGGGGTLTRGSAVPEWARGTFCTYPKEVGCAPDGRMVAYCDISRWEGNLPSGYQYFEDPTVGGGLRQMDFCPSFTTPYRLEQEGGAVVLDCTSPSLEGSWFDGKDELFGENSRCVERVDAGASRPICLEARCDDRGSGRVELVADGGSIHTCDFEGQELALPGGSVVRCPRFAQICPQSACPANCAGRGVCNFSLPRPECECFDRDDAHPFCMNSPYSFAPTTSPAPTVSPGPSAVPTVSTQPSSTSLSSGAVAGDPASWLRATVALSAALCWGCSLLPY